MKYITYLVVCLVMLLAAPVVWAGQVGNTIDMPEYSPSLALEFSPVVAAHCRDVFPSIQQAVIYTKQTVSQKPNLGDSTRIWAGNQTLIPNGDGFTLKGAEKRTGIGLVFTLAMRQYETSNMKSLGNHLAGGIV